MISKYTVLTIVLLFPFWLQAQKEIQVVYDDHNHSLALVPDIHIIEAGEKYQLRIQNINPVYIEDHIRISNYRYISPIPEILKPILPGISNSNVFDHFEVKPSGQREIFLKVLRFFNELEKLRSESDDLYVQTRLIPNTILARTKLDRIHTLFDTKEILKMVSQIVYYQDYILAVESVYKTNLKKVTLQTPDADLVLQEYSRLTRIADKIRRINYVQLLDFIIESNHTRDYILSEVFTGEKDFTEIKLALYDSYINDTIYSGTLTFQTKRNWRINFSTGFFYTNINSKEYYLNERTEDINDVIEESNFRGDVSVGALIHFSYKVKPDISLGPALGASISPLDGNIRYLGGLSAIIGKKRIFGISTGVSIGQIKAISGQVPSDQLGSYLPAGETKIPRYSQIKTGFFIGLTYNLTQTKKP